MCWELTQGGKFTHCVKIFWLQRKLEMLCIKMFWTVTLWDGFICSSNPCVELDLACQRCEEVHRGLVLGQFGSGWS